MDVYMAHDVSPTAMATSSIIFPKYHADVSRVAGGWMSSSLTNSAVANDTSPHRSTTKARAPEVEERNQGVDPGVVVVAEGTQQREDPRKNQRSAPLAANDPPDDEQQEEKQQHVPDRIRRPLQHDAGGAANTGPARRCSRESWRRIRRRSAGRRLSASGPRRPPARRRTGRRGPPPDRARARSGCWSRRPGRGASACARTAPARRRSSRGARRRTRTCTPRGETSRAGRARRRDGHGTARAPAA